MCSSFFSAVQWCPLFIASSDDFYYHQENGNIGECLWFWFYHILDIHGAFDFHLFLSLGLTCWGRI